MNRELLQQALNALLISAPLGHAMEDYEYRHRLIKDIEAELAKPEQASTEPPDYVEPPTSDYHNGWEEGFEAAKNLFKKESASQNADPRLLLVRSDNCNAPQELAKPEQEPVARFNWNEAKFEWLTEYSFDKHHMKPLYLAPPRKPWVGLTDKEMELLVIQAREVPIEIPCDSFTTRLLKLAEAKLKDKNTTN